MARVRMNPGMLGFRTMGASRCSAPSSVARRVGEGWVDPAAGEAALMRYSDVF